MKTEEEVKKQNGGNRFDTCANLETLQKKEKNIQIVLHFQVFT